MLAHWSLLVGLVVFSRGFDIGAWIGFFLIILIHEAGHALLARRFGLQVHRIEMHGLGGLCAYGGWASPYQHAAIAWGGVLAQGALFLVALALSMLQVFSFGIAGRIMHMFVTANLFIIGLNLLPLPFLDGGTAWKLLPMLANDWRRAKGRGRKKRDPRSGARSGARDVVSMDSFRKKGPKRRSSNEDDDDDKPLLH